MVLCNVSLHNNLHRVASLGCAQRPLRRRKRRLGDVMPMTFTFHWYGFTITIRVKRDSRNS